jgi:hypothetical protein
VRDGGGVYWKRSGLVGGRHRQRQALADAVPAKVFPAGCGSPPPDTIGMHPLRDRSPRRRHAGTGSLVIDADTIHGRSCVIIQSKGLHASLPEDMDFLYAAKDAFSSLPAPLCASDPALPSNGAPLAPPGIKFRDVPDGISKAHESPMKTPPIPTGRTGPHGRCTHRPLRSAAISLLALGVAFGACAQTPKSEPAAERDTDLLEGILADPSAETPPPANGETAPAASAPATGTDDTIPDPGEIDIGTDIDAGVTDPAAQVPEGASPVDPTHDGAASTTDDMGASAGATDDASPLAAWLEPLRISLKHELSYKFTAPTRVVNNRSSVRLEYSKPLTSNLFLRLDTKFNLHWGNDHRARAKQENPFRELVTREAYLQSSFGTTSFRLGYQILPWGVSEGGAITDEVSPRNSAEYFFISLEESRVGQPMLTVDHFNDAGQWTAFFVPRPGYNKYPDRGSEYDIPGSFDKKAPDDGWDNPGTYEFGARWKRTFGKSDISLMAARLMDNDYLVRQQRFRMFGLTANIAIDNLILRTEVALKQPRAFFAGSSSSNPTIVESDQFDSSFGFDYSPGGRPLTYSAEITWSRLLDWRDDIIGRERNEYSLIGSVSNRFFNDDLTLTWLTIYNRPYTTFQHKFLSSYQIDDNSTVYFELFYPDERDERSGTWPYRDEKQFVLRYQYQF